MKRYYLESKHVIDCEKLSFKHIVQSPPVTELLPPLISDSGTVVVRGFQQPVHEYMLDLYFTHEAKSGGGPIDQIEIKEREAFIVFTDQASKLYFNQEFMMYRGKQCTEFYHSLKRPFSDPFQYMAKQSPIL